MPPGFRSRSSTSALDCFDDFDPPPRPVRWDREKFERVRSRGPPYDDREVFRYEERVPAPPVAVEERVPPSRFEERRFYEDDVYIDRRPGYRPDFLDREEPSPEEVASRALAPYRRRTVREVSPPARSSRPPVLRRQSSLDTFDRPPVQHHHHHYEEEREWRPPTGVDIPLPIRRRRSPPPDRYREDEFEEIRYKDVEPDFKEDYREVEIRREKSRVRKPRSERSSRSKHQAPSSSSSTTSFEEIVEAPPLPGKRGKTRMPKRLVHRKAIVELGYPFEEEDDFLIVKRALEKPQIDEIIKISEAYRVEDKDKVTTYRYDKEEIIEAPPPPPSIHDPPPTIIDAPPPPPSVHSSSHHTHRSHRSHHTHKSHHSHHSPYSHHTHTVRSVSPPREIIEERIEERTGPLVVVPEHRHRSDREIREEIRELERERRALQLEREVRDVRITEVEYPVTEYEVVEERPARTVIRVDKDHKVVRSRTRSRPPNPKLVAAMMSTLT